MHETSKAIVTRLLADPDFLLLCGGDVLDIGPGDDPLGGWAEHLPRMRSYTGFDKPEGDAQAMAGLPEAGFDFVYSSHCLEHVVSAHEALARWWALVREGGALWVRVPEWQRYERGWWPSRGNPDHKAAFVLGALPRPVNAPVYDVLKLVAALPGADVLRVWRPRHGYREHFPREHDQTLGLGHAEIEMVVRKYTAAERAAGGKVPQVAA